MNCDVQLINGLGIMRDVKLMNVLEISAGWNFYVDLYS